MTKGNRRNSTVVGPFCLAARVVSLDLKWAISNVRSVRLDLRGVLTLLLPLLLICGKGQADEYATFKLQFNGFDITPLNAFDDELNDEIVPELVYSKRIALQNLGVEVLTILPPLTEERTFVRNAPAIGFKAPVLSIEREVFILVIEGALIIDTKGTKYELSKHDLVYAPAGIVAAAWEANPGARVVAFSSPSQAASLYRPATQQEIDSDTVGEISILNIDDKDRYRQLGPGVDSLLIHGQRMSVEIYSVDSSKREYLTPLDAHNEEELGLFLEGSLRMYTAGKENHIRRGDVMVLPPNIPHRGHYAPSHSLVFAVSSPKSPPSGSSPTKSLRNLLPGSVEQR